MEEALTISYNPGLSNSWNFQ